MLADEVAELLGVGRRTLRRLHAEEKLCAINVRGSVRYIRNDVRKYLGVDFEPEWFAEMLCPTIKDVSE